MHKSNDTRETGFKWEDKSGDNRNEALYCHKNIDSVYCISYIETNIESFSSLFGSSNELHPPTDPPTTLSPPVIPEWGKIYRSE